MPNEELNKKIEEVTDKVKEVAQDLTKKAKDVSKEVSEKAGIFIDAAKKKIEVEKLEFALIKKFREYGKTCYYAKADGKECDCSVLYDEITSIIKQLSDLNVSKEDIDEAVDKVDNAAAKLDDIIENIKN